MASPRPDKAATEMLRQSLGREPGSSAANDLCPEPEVLASYFERSLNAEETARCELHLSACARCREELALMDRAGRDVATGQEGAQDALRRWLWDWRWLAPAAAALIIAAIWIVQRPSNPQRESQQPLVAMSQPSEPPAKELPAPSAAAAPGAAPAAPAPSGMAQNRALDKTQKALSREMAQSAANENREAAVPLDARRDADSNLPAKSAGAPANAPEERAARTNTESKTMVGALQNAPASPAAAAPLGQAANTMRGTARAEAGATAQVLKSKQMADAATPNLYAKKDEKAAPAAGGTGIAARVVRTPDPKVLWRIPEQGLQKSEDGGATWRQADLPVANARIAFIAAPSAQVCWVAGRGGIILRTTDGTHWEAIASPAHADFVQIAAENASSATVATAEGLRFQTSDAGKQWNAIP